MTTAYGHDEHGHTDEFHEDSPTFRYRYGYQVADAEPRLVGTLNDRADAVRAAKRAAETVRFDLRSLGAPSVVSVWVQQRKRTVTVEFSKPEVIAP